MTGLRDDAGVEVWELRPVISRATAVDALKISEAATITDDGRMIIPDGIDFNVEQRENMGCFRLDKLRAETEPHHVAFGKWRRYVKFAIESRAAAAEAPAPGSAEDDADAAAARVAWGPAAAPTPAAPPPPAVVVQQVLATREVLMPADAGPLVAELHEEVGRLRHELARTRHELREVATAAARRYELAVVRNELIDRQQQHHHHHQRRQQQQQEACGGGDMGGVAQHPAYADMDGGDDGGCGSIDWPGSGTSWQGGSSLGGMHDVAGGEVYGLRGRWGGAGSLPARSHSPARSRSPFRDPLEHLTASQTTHHGAHQGQVDEEVERQKEARRAGAAAFPPQAGLPLATTPSPPAEERGGDWDHAHDVAEDPSDPDAMTEDLRTELGPTRAAGLAELQQLRRSRSASRIGGGTMAASSRAGEPGARARSARQGPGQHADAALPSPQVPSRFVRTLHEQAPLSFPPESTGTLAGAATTDARAAQKPSVAPMRPASARASGSTPSPRTGRYGDPRHLHITETVVHNLESAARRVGL